MTYLDELSIFRQSLERNFKEFVQLNASNKRIGNSGLQELVVWRWRLVLAAQEQRVVVVADISLVESESISLQF